MIYKKATINDLNEILIMKNEVKQRVIKDNLPIWLNGYPLDQIIIDDINDNEGRIVVIDNEIIAYACFHHAFKEYGNGVFKKDNVYSFGRVMVKNNFLNKHVGSFIVKSMIEEAKSLNVDGIGILVDSCNIKAVNLYKKYGFIKEGARKFPFAYLDIYGLYF